MCALSRFYAPSANFQKFLTAFITSRYLPFIWLIHTGWQTSIQPDQLPEKMATKRRPSMRTRMKVEDVSSWVEHNQVPLTYSPHEEGRVRFNVPTKRLSEESLESGSTEESLEEDPLYLDGGYGWIVVFYSFCMHAILDGSSFCLGIVYVAIQKYYEVNRFEAGFAASFFLSLPLLIAPIAGLVSDLFGCRCSIWLGALIASVSCAVSIICPNIWLFTITFGVGCGIGMGFVYNAAIVVVTYYFNKKRGIATSFAVSGTGVGTFVFPLYMEAVRWALGDLVGELQAYLISFLIGFIIITVIGFLYVDIQWTSDTPKAQVRAFDKKVKALLEEQEDTNTSKKEVVLRHAISLPNLNTVRADAGSIISLCEAGTDKKTEMPARSKSVALFENQRPSMPTIPEYSMLNSGLEHLEHLDLELANSPCNTVKATRKRVISKLSMSVDQINEMDEEDFKINILTSTESESSSESSSDDSEMSNDGDSSSSELTEKVADPTIKLINKNLNNVIFTRSASSAPNSARINRNSLVQGTSNVCGGRVMASNAIQGRFASNLLSMGKIPSAPMLMAPKKRKLHPSPEIIQMWNKLCEEAAHYPKICKSHAFKWLSFSVFFLYLILDVPYVYFYDYAIENLKMSEAWGSNIYSAIGITNIVFTMIYGKLADCYRPRIPTFYAVGMFFVGISMGIAILADNKWKLLGCGILFGSAVTANYALQSIIVTICFRDMNQFNAGYSLLSMIEGVASFLGPTFVFAPLRERFGDYNFVFAIASVSAFLSAIGMVAFFHCHQKETAQEEAEEALKKKQAKKRSNGTNGTSRETQGLLLA